MFTSTINATFFCLNKICKYHTYQKGKVETNSYIQLQYSLIILVKYYNVFLHSLVYYFILHVNLKSIEN